MDRNEFLINALSSPLKSSPQKIIIEHIEAFLKNYENRHHFSGRERLLETIIAGKVQEGLAIIKELDSSNLETIHYVEYLNIWASIANAQVFFLTQKFTMANNLDAPQESEKDLFKDFSMPFPEILFSFEHADGGCMPIFISMFSMPDKIKMNDVFQTLYCGKIMFCLDGELAQTYGRGGAILEFNFTRELLPRIFIKCEHMDTCPNCIRKNIFSHSYIDGNETNISEDQCLRTLRTSKNCPQNMGPFFIRGLGPDIMETIDRLASFFGGKRKFNYTTIAEQAYQTLKIACIAIQKFMRRPSQIKKLEQIKENFKDYTKAGKREYKDKYDFLGDHVVRFSDRDVAYANLHTGKRVHKGTHKPPCEHYRKSFTRTYASGRVVQVRETIVNKGNKKTIVMK